MSASLETIRSAIWRVVFSSRSTATTVELAAKIGCKTRDVYRHARALARKRFVVVTTPPPCRREAPRACGHQPAPLQGVPCPA